MIGRHGSAFHPYRAGYAVFNRVKHVDHEARKFDALTDPWLLWDGLGD